MRPICRISIDGRVVSGEFMNRLVSCRVTDKEGISSDEAEIILVDWPPVDVPKKDARITVEMGYDNGISFMGEFLPQEVELSCLPYTMRVTSKSTGFDDAASRRERHWDNKTLGDIVSQIANENGMEASVDPDLSSFNYSWIGQVDESDVAFLDRLARRHDAIFAIKAGKVIFAKRGAGTTPSGTPLTSSVIRPGIVVPGSAKFIYSDREKYKRVIATYMDRGAGKRKEVAIDSDPEAEGDFTIDDPFASEAEARAAATAKSQELKRRALTFEVDIVGNPYVRAGAPITFDGMRSTIDGIEFLVESATHNFSKSGYTTMLSGKVKV